MGVSGNLKSMLPADLLQWLSLGQKTGTLVLNHSGTEKKIFFRAGRVISSASNDPREYLGQFLMSHGYLTEPELKKAMEVQGQSGILLGKILVMIDVISEEDLQRLMRLKAEEEIYDMFLWQEADFHFIDDVLPQMEMIPLQVDVTGLIMEGTRRVDEWQRIREVVPHDGLVPEMLKPAGEDMELTDVQNTIVAAIDGKRSIADIVLESRSSTFVVSSTLHMLIRQKIARATDPEAEKPAMKVEVAAPVATQQPEEFSEDDEIAALLNAAQASLRKREFDKAQRLLKAAQNLDPTHPKVRAAVKGAEAAIVGELRKEGILESKIPRVVRSFDEMKEMNFTPNEGFMLSRINGTWDIGSLMKISPIREPEALLIFYKFQKDGLIVLE
jgi:hypothetical protein